MIRSSHNKSLAPGDFPADVGVRLSEFLSLVVKQLAFNNKWALVDLHLLLSARTGLFEGSGLKIRG